MKENQPIQAESIQNNASTTTERTNSEPTTNQNPCTAPSSMFFAFYIQSNNRKRIILHAFKLCLTAKLPCQLKIKSFTKQGNHCDSMVALALSKWISKWSVNSFPLLHKQHLLTKVHYLLIS